MNIFKLQKCMSLNKYRNAHYFKINEEKAEYKVLVRFAMQESKEKIRLLKTPIKTIFTFYSYRGRDIDGEIISVKNFHDSLTELGMIPDDNQNYLQSFEVKGTKEKGNFYNVKIIENYENTITNI